MRKLISSISMTLEGFCYHTVVIANDDMHENANDWLGHAGMASGAVMFYYEPADNNLHIK